MEDDGGLQGEQFHRHHKLVEWITSEPLNGSLHPYVRIAHTVDKGFHMVVAQEQQIRAETRIVSCPVGATISVLNAFEVKPFESHGTRLPRAFLMNNVTRPEMIQAFFLMEQDLRGGDSWWAPYIDTLPSLEDVNDMQFDSAEDGAWLEGTNLKTAIVTQTAKWQDLYARGLRSLKVLGWPNALNEKYSWELYRWAATIFGSRSFSCDVLNDTLPADQARMGGRHGVPKCESWLKDLFVEKFSVLLPMLDILNHWPETPVKWQAHSSFVGMQVLENYDSGQELCNNYGPKDNGGLLLSYAFVIPNNRFDHVLIAVSTPPGSPLGAARSWKKDERSLPEPNLFILHPEHPTARQSSCLEAHLFSYDLIDTISILCGNDRELQTMYMEERSLMSTSLGLERMLSDCRNLLATLSQLLRECRTKRQKLQDSHSHGLEPRTPKQRAAQTYRSGQYLLYQMGSVLCEYVLRRASSETSHGALVERLKESFDEHTVTRFCVIYEAYPPITKAGELLSASAIAGMLPSHAASRWRETARSIMDRMRVTELEAMVASKTISALLLSAAYHGYERRTSLPFRLRKWLEQLTSWYPPEDPNWSYVPHTGPWQPGEEPPPDLMRLLEAARSLLPPDLGASSAADPVLEPEMLCWGWNVMEEEGVTLPADLGGFRLYCKQY